MKEETKQKILERLEKFSPEQQINILKLTKIRLQRRLQAASKADTQVPTGVPTPEETDHEL